MPHPQAPDVGGPAVAPSTRISSPGVRWTLTSAWLLLPAHAGAVLWAWGRLPERIPLHFNAMGTPDAWGPASPWTILLPVVTHLILLAALTYGTLHPERSNLPGRVQLRDLPPDAARRVMGVVQVHLGAIAVLASAMLCLIGTCVPLIALGYIDQLPTPPLWLIVGALLATLGWLFVDVERAKTAPRGNP